MYLPSLFPGLASCLSVFPPLLPVLKNAMSLGESDHLRVSNSYAALVRRQFVPLNFCKNLVPGVLLIAFRGWNLSPLYYLEPLGIDQVITLG